MKLIKNNKITNITSLEDARRFKEQQMLQKKIKKAHDIVESLLEKLTEASDMLKELGISSILINNEHLVIGTVVKGKFYSGLVIEVDGRIFQILANPDSGSDE